jgi:methylenetetrahydrofolate reductase (NADPH)
MHIRDIFAIHPTTFSFEFFPPKSDDAEKNLLDTIRDLESLRPSFVSVTYGAGGATRQRTHDLVVKIKETTSCDPIPHLTCVMHNQEEIEAILQRYSDARISNILALGGDPPGNALDYDRSGDPFRHASDLVRYIKKYNEKGIHPADKRGFGIGVAGFPEGHPSTPNRIREMDNLKAKVDEGADYVVTQLFFDNHNFYDFRDRCILAGIRVPIIAGVMPVTSSKGLARMAELALGAHFPAKLLRAIARCQGDEEYVRKVGVQWATEQCRDLLDNEVRGIHFYTLNRSTATREIYASLGVKDSRMLESTN